MSDLKPIEPDSSGYQGEKDCTECEGKQTVRTSGGSTESYSWDNEHCISCGYRTSKSQRIDGHDEQETETSKRLEMVE